MPTAESVIANAIMSVTTTSAALTVGTNTTLPVTIVTSSAGDVETIASVNAMNSATYYFCVIVYPVLMLLTVVGNALVIAALAPIWEKLPTANTYYVALALMDLIAGVLDLTRVMAKTLGDLDLLDRVGCGNATFVLFTFSDTASWLVVAIGCDRLLHVFRPFTARDFCTPRRVIIVCAGLFAATAAINLHLPFTTARDGLPVWLCPAKPGFEAWLSGAWVVLDTAVIAGLPFLLIAISGLAIVARLRRNRRLLQQRLNSKDRRANTLLLVITVSFLLTVTPMVILHNLIGQFNLEDPRGLALYSLLDIVLSAVFNVNRAANVVFYSIVSRAFRIRLRMLLFCFHSVSPSDVTHSYISHR